MTSFYKRAAVLALLVACSEPEPQCDGLMRELTTFADHPGESAERLDRMLGLIGENRHLDGLKSRLTEMRGQVETVRTSTDESAVERARNGFDINLQLYGQMVADAQVPISVCDPGFLAAVEQVRARR